MNSTDPGPSGGTGTMDRANTLSSDSGPDTSLHTVTIRATKACRTLPKQKSAAPGIAGGGGEGRADRNRFIINVGDVPISEGLPPANGGKVRRAIPATLHNVAEARSA
ncbi:MAG: hypothetical protein ACREDR_30380 [Blastocatellia bacterium]